MACTIARIAAKLATSPLQRVVATEPRQIRLRIGADGRFAAAVGGAARYFADRAGLGTDDTARLQSAAVAACCEALENLTDPEAHLDVTLAWFADRIEVAFSHHGDVLPAAGLDSIAGLAPHLGAHGGNGTVFGGVDRVQHDTEGDAAVTRLTKYLGHATRPL